MLVGGSQNPARHFVRSQRADRENQLVILAERLFIEHTHPFDAATGADVCALR